jgi:hypothetical protein
MFLAVKGSLPGEGDFVDGAVPSTMILICDALARATNKDVERGTTYVDEFTDFEYACFVD